MPMIRALLIFQTSELPAPLAKLSPWLEMRQNDRDEPNILLVHYEDLIADLSGEMRQVAARREIAVPEATWPSLVKAATFEQTQAAAGRLAWLHTRAWGRLAGLSTLPPGGRVQLRNGAS
jgi:Sulfotransferase domain